MKKLLLILLCIAFSGCATMFNKNISTLTFTSDPEGTMVYINNIPSGKTPLEIEVYDKKPIAILFEKDGYEGKGYTIGTSIDKKWLILNLPIYGWIADLISGKFYTLNEKKIHITLEPIKQEEK